MTRLLGFILGLVLLAGTVSAQDFVFVSERIRATPEVAESGDTLFQNELYRYLDGSEIRLTFTPGEEESDPAPSPSGRYLAYLVTDKVIDWQAEVVPFDWTSKLRIMDLESGLLVEEWPALGHDGQMPIAGGFDIVWHPDERSLLVQVFNYRGETSIARYEVGNPDPRILTRGAGIILDETRGWFATWVDGFVTVFDPASGNSYPLIPGSPMAWLDGRLVIGGAEQLLLMDPVTAEQTVIASEGDYISDFASSPDGSRHVWSASYRDRGLSVISVADSNFNVVAEWVQFDSVRDLSWMNSGSILMTVYKGEYNAIQELRLEDGAEFLLVGALSHNYDPVVVPRVEDE